VGEKSIDVNDGRSAIADRRAAIADFCRQIETYLCQKNDGHLIRVVGPSFDLVSGWAQRGVPLRVAYAGIDRYFERYYRSGPRRRPVKIDFCEADVLDVFDEWVRATGVSQSSVTSRQSPVESGVESSVETSAESRRASLPAHLQRVVRHLTAARASGSIGEAFDTIVDRASAELDAARAKAAGLRGEPRRALIDRLRALDAELLAQARAALEDGARAELGREADADLAAFRSTMAEAAYARAREAAIDRLVRERFRLPIVSYD